MRPWSEPTGRDAGALPRPRAARKTQLTMTSRTLTTTVAGRAGSMRRMRRRTAAAGRIYCSTNGCTSFLHVDPATGVARCAVCGYIRRNR
jgi:hypothetical protein